jgi:DNA-binding CsgD family transcriptional regulator
LRNRCEYGGGLGQLFGLTPTECALACRLMTGESLQDAASGLAISLGHAQQRLISIFDKTGTCRQGELIALMSKLS